MSPKGSYSAPFAPNLFFVQYPGRFRKKGKSQFFELPAENHLDRQSVVGFTPEGSYSVPFAPKRPILAVSGGF